MNDVDVLRQNLRKFGIVGHDKNVEFVDLVKNCLFHVLFSQSPSQTGSFFRRVFGPKNRRRYSRERTEKKLFWGPQACAFNCFKPGKKDDILRIKLEK